MTRTKALAAYFTARPNTWISALDLMPLGGLCGWRSRLSDLRRAPHFLNIRNQTRVVIAADGRRVLISEYMNFLNVTAPNMAPREVTTTEGVAGSGGTLPAAV